MMSYENGKKTAFRIVVIAVKSESCFNPFTCEQWAVTRDLY